MGLQQVSSQHAVVPLNKENLDQTLTKRLKILFPYLAAIARAKEATSDPRERQRFDVLYGLLEITEISKLRTAEMVEEWDRTEKPTVLARMKGQP
jgi:hypothetical protein